ncbi:hypothetical protein WK33_06885 [Burkholderia multivorans]|nr:hypothetical protein WK33_06885 [Burkholderia multivorans]
MQMSEFVSDVSDDVDVVEYVVRNQAHCICNTNLRGESTDWATLRKQSIGVVLVVDHTSP